MRTIPFLRSPDGQPLAPTRRLMALLGVLLLVLTLVTTLGTAWLFNSFRGERQWKEQTAVLDAVADQASAAIESMVLAGDVTGVRKYLMQVATVPGVSGARITLPDGRVLADTTSKRIDVPALPKQWAGPIDVDSTEGPAGESYIPRTIQIPRRGPLFLKLTRAQTHSGLSLNELTALAMLGVVAMLVVFIGHRRLRKELTAATSLSDAVSAAATRADVALAELKLGDAVCPEASSWNALLDRFATLEQSMKAVAMRSMLNGPDAGVRSAGSEAAGNRHALEAVVDLLPTGVLLINGDGTIREVNGAGATLLGAERSTMIGVEARSLIADAVFHEALASTLARTHGGERRVLELDRRDQHAGVLRLSIRPLRREDQGGALLMIEDVTQQRIADASRNKFVAQATHELRAPLTNMRLCLETALEDDMGNVEALAQHLNVLNDETRRLERLVAEMLSVAEIEAGSLSLKEDDVKLDRLFDELRANNAPACAEKGIELTFDLPPKLPLMRGDREKLSAALQNLVNNAIKYTPANGKIKIAARQEDNRFLIETADTGFGIAPEDQPKIFERFFRANDPRVKKITGTGLGLAISRDVARLHGGELTFKSELNQGTTFTLQLPVPAQAA